MSPGRRTVSISCEVLEQSSYGSKSEQFSQVRFVIHTKFCPFSLLYSVNVACGHRANQNQDGILHRYFKPRTSSHHPTRLHLPRWKQLLLANSTVSTPHHTVHNDDIRKSHFIHRTNSNSFQFLCASNRSRKCALFLSFYCWPVDFALNLFLLSTLFFFHIDWYFL